MNQSFYLVISLVLIFHSISICFKFPMISILNLFVFVIAVCFIVLVFTLDDPQLAAFQQISKNTHLDLYILLIFIVFVGKVFGKLLVRSLLKQISKWDNYNQYVEERLHLEQFESLNQIKNISLHNTRHSTTLININEVQY